VKDGILHVFEGGWQHSIRLESNTGLYTFGQRYYDTDLGRWTQMDPVGGTVGNPNSGNPYVYANDEPNMLVDPSGACDYVTIVILIGAIIAGGLVLAALAPAGVPTATAIFTALTTTITPTTAVTLGFLGTLAGFLVAVATALQCVAQGFGS